MTITKHREYCKKRNCLTTTQFNSIQCVKFRCQKAEVQLPLGLLTALPMWILYSLWISWISIFSQGRI